MSKHLKIFVSVLFIVIIILAIGITRFYFDVSKDTENTSDTPVMYSKSESDSNGFCIFESSNNLYGVIDENEKVIIEPQWLSVDFAGNGYYIVSDSFNDEILFGCVDSEENVIVPFIYSRIEEFGTDEKRFYSARVSENNSCVIYDDTFKPCFERVWDRCDIDENTLNVYYGSNSYSYFAESDGLELKSAVVKNSAGELDYTINFYSRVLLSKLDYKKIEKISDCISSYLEYSLSGDYSIIQKSSIIGTQQSFTTFFSEYTNVFSRKFKSIDDISVYHGKQDDGTQYIIASIAVDADVSYMDGEMGVAVSDKYRAVIKFDYSGTDVRMMSAEFTDDEIKKKDKPEHTAEIPENL